MFVKHWKKILIGSLVAVVIEIGFIVYLFLSPPIVSLSPKSSTVVSSLPTSAPPSHVGTSTTFTTPSGKPVQFVILSFDGSRSLTMWDETRNFARQMMASGTPVHFTYFISGVYFVDRAHATLYQPPRAPAGFSNIGFATSPADVAARIAQINSAIAEGHEIGSHVNGHFNGSHWSLDDWQQEFSAFYSLLFDAAKNNHVPAVSSSAFVLNMSTSSIIGFRAPELGVSPGLWATLKKFGYQYDASRPARLGTWPYKIAPGIWEFPLSGLPIGPRHHPVLSMDYNFYVAQTRAKSIARRGTPLWDHLYQEVLSAYREYFATNYNGNRAPVIIGDHFSEWNDNVYWEALKTFASETCVEPEVRCVTFKEAVDYLNSHH